jgi:hypothetical protein
MVCNFPCVKFIISEMFTLLQSNFSFVGPHFSVCSKFMKENFEALFKVYITGMVVYSMQNTGELCCIATVVYSVIFTEIWQTF